MNRDSLRGSFVLLAVSLSGCALGDVATDMSDWRDSVVANPSADTGCFHASYPDMTWAPVACGAAPASLGARALHADAVGDGADYALQSATPTFAATGSFVAAENVTSETSGGSATNYVLSLATNPIANPASCQGGGSACEGWTGFFYYATAQGASAMVADWLIGYGSACPAPLADGSAWESDDQGDCLLTSSTLSLATVAVDDLAGIKMGARAVAGGNDVLVFASGSDAFTTSAADSGASLASAWTTTEFNIFGDGSDGANFNPGARLRLRIGVDDGSTAAPTCAGSAGEIVYTNNLTLGACEALGGTEPSIEFTESD